MTLTFVPDRLPVSTLNLAKKLQKLRPTFLSNFYLSGGTGLAVQIGHRESEDLDFFSKNGFDPIFIQNELIKIGSLQKTEIEAGTVNTFLDGVKLQFLEYPYKLVKPLVDWDGVKLSSIEDIACTKLQTVGARGSKKDFVDLYFIFDKYTIEELFILMKQKYENVDFSRAHILKSLVFFETAESEPMPRMHVDLSWDDVKKRMIDIVKNYKF